MSDKYDEYFESQEANDDSKSDSRVALVLIAVFVVGMVFWVSAHKKEIVRDSGRPRTEPACLGADL